MDGAAVQQYFYQARLPDIESAAKPALFGVRNLEANVEAERSKRLLVAVQGVRATSLLRELVCFAN